MEIITPGADLSEANYRGKCLECGCIFRCKYSETKRYVDLYTKCPNCKRHVFVDYEKQTGQS